MDHNKEPNADNGEQFPPEVVKLKVVSSRNFSTASLIAAPVSLFFGGVFLSIAALVFGIASFVKVRSVMRGDARNDPFVKMIYIRSIICMGISVIASILNAYALVSMMPMITDMLQGADIDEMLETLEDYTSNDPGATNGDAASDGTEGESVFG